MELIKVFLENNGSAETVAYFSSDELYNECLSSIEGFAGENGYTDVTESVNEDGLVYLCSFIDEDGVVDQFLLDNPLEIKELSSFFEGLDVTGIINSKENDKFFYKNGPASINIKAISLF